MSKSRLVVTVTSSDLQDGISIKNWIFLGHNPFHFLTSKQTCLVFVRVCPQQIRGLAHQNECPITCSSYHSVPGFIYSPDTKPFCENWSIWRCKDNRNHYIYFWPKNDVTNISIRIVQVVCQLRPSQVTRTFSTALHLHACPYYPPTSFWQPSIV